LEHTLRPFCKIGTGKHGSGLELSHNLKSESTSDSGLLSSSTMA